MIYVLMPAYNEAHSLNTILPAVPTNIDGIPIHVVVIDDGSTDDTAAVARKNGCQVLQHASNQGKGASLKTGLAHIGDSDFEAIVLIDADGQHDPKDMLTILCPILDSSADMVVGSRYRNDTARGSTPLNRYLVRATTVAVLRKLLRIEITDPYSGYRGISPGMAGCLTLRGDRYEAELEMAFCAARAAKPVLELPIARIYGPATSKMGSRFGPLLGRLDVVSHHLVTIVREAMIGTGPRATAPTTVRPT